MDYGPVLSAHDCFELGRQAYNVGDHHHAEMWMSRALDRLREEEEQEEQGGGGGRGATVDRADILEYMAFSAYVTVSTKNVLLLCFARV